MTAINSIPVAIIGASGYSGAELASLLLAHPHVRIAGLFGSGKSEKSGGLPPTFDEVFANFRNALQLPVHTSDVDVIARLKPGAVFLCTPHEASLELAPQLLARGLTVFDLSAAFRLRDASAYTTFYGFTHTHTQLLETSVYGLAELHRKQIATANLIAVAGCYPTSIILPLAPLVRAGAIAKKADGSFRRPIIDATSGVSGAGRKAEQRLLFCEVSQQAYGVFKHRHQPEIDAYAGISTYFTPHVGPYERGILSTIHIELSEGWTEQRVRETLHSAYGREPFIHLCKSGVWPAVKDVAHTNRVDIALAVDARGHCIISSAIDNLTKGAAGQAVQCMNIRLGFPETTALPIA